MNREDTIFYLRRIGKTGGNLYAIAIAVSDIQKQIPTSIYLQGGGYFDGELVYDTAICPSCGYVLDDDYDQENNYEPYCPHCGQRLNWEVGETE